jgi:hypothetical protein
MGACKAAKHDNNKLSNIKGYESISTKNKFKTIQNIKNKQNPIINPQLPATHVNLSAILSRII